MELSEARAVLGVGPDASTAEVRAAYRRMVRTHHPDLVADLSSNATTVRINQAYAVLREVPRATNTPVATNPKLVDGAVERPHVGLSQTDGDVVTISAPLEESFFRLLEAAYSLGDVTHVDVDDGLLETLVATDDGRYCSLVISFQPLDHLSTEALITLQPLDSGSCPALDSITEYIAAAVRG